jgi:hypothetical protein
MGYEKILKCQPLASDYDYFRVGTCGIDKTSSEELSEAINSLYIWYEKAAVCFVCHLDVVSTDPVETFRKS